MTAITFAALIAINQTIILETGCSRVHQNVDRAVVETALLGFFTSTSWNERYWNRGDRVLIYDRWIENKRHSFSEDLEEATRFFGIGMFKHFSPTPNELQAVHDLARLRGSDLEVPTLMALAEMDLDTRIVKSGTDRLFEWNPPERRDPGERGDSRTFRAIGKLFPPAYSKNGLCVSLKMETHRSVFKGTITFFLKKANGSWQIGWVHQDFYLREQWPRIAQEN